MELIIKHCKYRLNCCKTGNIGANFSKLELKSMKDAKVVLFCGWGQMFEISQKKPSGITMLYAVSIKV